MKNQSLTAAARRINDLLAEKTIHDGLELKTASIPESNADGAGGAHQFASRIDRLEMADGVGHVDRNDGVAVQGNHHAETSGGDQVDGGHAKAGRQDAVEGRGRASALNVSQHADPHFFAGAVADGIADQGADGAGAAVLLQFRRELHAFSHHDDGEVLSGFFALGNVAANVLDGERDLRNEDDVSATGDTGLERDPAAVTAHHLNHHHPMMGLGRGMNLVDGIGDGVQRSVKSKSNLSGGEIVVDGLGHADDLHSLLSKLVADLLRSVAANGDDSVDAQFGCVGDNLARNVARGFLAVLLDASVMKGIAAVRG